MFYNVKGERIIINEEYMDVALDELEANAQYILDDMGRSDLQIKVGFSERTNEEDSKAWMELSIVIFDPEGEVVGGIIYVHDGVYAYPVHIGGDFEFFYVFNFLCCSETKCGTKNKKFKNKIIEDTILENISTSTKFTVTV